MLAVIVTIVLRPGLLWAALVALSIAVVLSLELIYASIEYNDRSSSSRYSPTDQAGKRRRRGSGSDRKFWLGERGRLDGIRSAVALNYPD